MLTVPAFGRRGPTLRPSLLAVVGSDRSAAARRRPLIGRLQQLWPGQSRGSGLERSLLSWAALLVLLLPAFLPLLRPGFFVSDDGRFHVYRIAALAHAWQRGVLHPRLFPEFGFDYGQAVLNFYAPLSYWPGALLTLLGLSPAAAAEVVIALSFLLAGLAAYAFVASLWGRAGGLLAAVAYTYFPYHLADAYVRGALPEHLAFVWPPLILWSYHAAFSRRQPGPPLLWAALAWAGLVYTHNLTALMMAPVTALYLLLLALWTRRWRRLVLAAGSLLLAMALSADYWLPVLWESANVGIGLGPSDGYRRHLAPLSRLVQWTPLYGYRLEQGGVADFPLSWLTGTLVLLVVLLAGWNWLHRRPLPHGRLLGFGFVLTTASALMITELALPVWRLTQPLLGHLQYPWRFLSMTAVGVMLTVGALPRLLRVDGPGRESGSANAGFVSASAQGTAPTARAQVSPQGKRRVALEWQGALLAAVVLLMIGVAVPGMRLEALALPAADTATPLRMWQEDAAAGQVGATWTGEFLPLTVSEQRWALGRPPEAARDGPPLDPRPTVRLTRLGYAWLELEAVSEQPLSIRLHQFHLPGWQAFLDDHELPTYPSSELGLVTGDVPAGSHRLVFQFGVTPARTAGAIISTLAAGLWSLLALAVSRRRPAQRGLASAAVALLLLTAVLGLNSLGLGQQRWRPHPVEARLEDVALLVAADVRQLPKAAAAEVTLYWFALREVGTNYKAFVHVLGPDGSVIAQQDGDPGGGFTPTTRWRQGEIIPDRHVVLLPDDLPKGTYALRAGLYQFEPLRNLTVDPPAPDNRVDIGSLVVR